MGLGQLQGMIIIFFNELFFSLVEAFFCFINMHENCDQSRPLCY